MRVIATAGHVDHGKSTLVTALTGTDPDRWDEEKVRGLTIDLGFASTRLPSGAEISFVDVPGHGRFVTNMLAGVSAVDACLFVVAATDGWKAQSEEHFRILELLGISRGLVALTKVGGLDEELCQFAALKVHEHLEGSFLAGAEMVFVDVLANIGVDELRSALDRLVAATPAAADRGRPRLWVDRSFAVRGAGTVVTGTLIDGPLSLNDKIALEPSNRTVRVRSLETHHRSLQKAEPGRRLAVNLAGISHHEVLRGHVLVRPEQWHRTRVIDASLHVLASVEQPLTARGAFAVYIGSGDFPARLRIIGGSRAINPGHDGAVRLWLRGQVPLPLLPGDHYVLRELGRSQTVGGGTVLDVDPIVSLLRATPDPSRERIVRERGWIEADKLERLTGQRSAPTIGRIVMTPTMLKAIRQEIVDAARAGAEAGADLASLSAIHRIVLAEGVPGVTIVNGRLTKVQQRSGSLSPEASRMLALLDAHPWAPPVTPITDRAALRELERQHLAVQIGELWFSTTAIDAAVAVVSDLLDTLREGFSVAAARVALGTTRKYVLPLLAYLDASGVTRRKGDLRIAGPRMARSRQRP